MWLRSRLLLALRARILRRARVGRRCLALLFSLLAQLVLVCKPQLLGHLLRLSILLFHNLSPLHDLIIALPTNSTPPAHAFACKLLPRRLGAVNATNLALRIRIHEAAYGDQGRPYSPSRLPSLLMVSANAQTNLTVDLKAARGRDEAEGRRAQWILRGQDNAAVVEADCVGRRLGRAAQRKVPFEQIIFKRFGVKVGRRLRGELAGFFDCWAVREFCDAGRLDKAAYECA